MELQKSTADCLKLSPAVGPRWSCNHAELRAKSFSPDRLSACSAHAWERPLVCAAPQEAAAVLLQVSHSTCPSLAFPVSISWQLGGKLPGWSCSVCWQKLLVAPHGFLRLLGKLPEGQKWCAGGVVTSQRLRAAMSHLHRLLGVEMGSQGV